MVCRRPNSKALHLVKQGGALQAESGGCSSRISELPIGTLASNEDLSTHLIFQRRIRNLWLQRLASLEWPWFKDAIIGENDAARDVVLQLSNVTGPVVANQGPHGFLRDGFDCFVHGVCGLLNEVFHELGEQLGLKLQWHVSNFIEEQSAAIRQREAADMRIDRARKGSTLVSEELAFQKPGWHRRAVHLDQIAVSTGAELVNRARDDFLACAGLSGN